MGLIPSSDSIQTLCISQTFISALLGVGFSSFPFCLPRGSAGMGLFLFHFKRLEFPKTCIPALLVVGLVNFPFVFQGEGGGGVFLVPF